MAVEVVGQNGEALSAADTFAIQQLGLDIKERLERFCREQGKPDTVALGCVLGLLWGWQRRAGLQEGSLTLDSAAQHITSMLGRRALEIWQACERAEEKRRQGNGAAVLHTGA